VGLGFTLSARSEQARDRGGVTLANTQLFVHVPANDISEQLTAFYAFSAAEAPLTINR
jgi:hypothetical protein